MDAPVPVIRLAPEAPHPGDVSIHLVPPASSSLLTNLIVYAPSAWLSRIPYFATILREPWCSSIHSNRESPADADADAAEVAASLPQLTLQCAPGSSTHAYFRCLRLLKLSPSCSPSMFETVSEALELLPVADHLLFKECKDACMGFLAANPWSCEEEDAIRATISNLGIKPPSAVEERLDTSQDVATLEEMLLALLALQGWESYFSALAKKCLENPSSSVKATSHSILLKLRRSYSTKLCEKDPTPRQWFLLTKVLLQFTDAHEIISEFISSQALFESLQSTSKDKKREVASILAQVFLKVLEGGVALTGSQRAALVKQWAPLRSSLNDTFFDSALRKVAEALPLNHPVLVDLVKQEMIRPKSDFSSGWSSRLLHRIGQLDEQEVEALCEKVTSIP